jgi:predicted transcriptional regulator
VAEKFYELVYFFLAAKDFREIVARIVTAHRHQKPVILGMGAHPIKVGLSPLIIRLMERGILQAVAMNGAGIIHDFEIALIGSTSEDVEEQLQTGAFGMAEETGREINQAIRDGVAAGIGIGESLGRYLADMDPEFGKYSLLMQAYMRSFL